MNNQKNGLHVEKNYSYEMMGKQIEITYAQNKRIKQKKKFELVSKLVDDLFKYKERTGCYSTISNLIISALLSTDYECPIDIYDNNGCLDERDLEFKKILQCEIFSLSNELPN
ncbi:MAG: hypothetical protein ACQERB_09420 [Promethearchaeati archaeon]